MANLYRCEKSREDYEELKKVFAMDSSKLQVYKNGTFLSCRYLTEKPVDGPVNFHHESWAMWKWHDPDAFVVKIGFWSLLKAGSVRRST